jgi:hypothetical protein
VIFVAQLPIIFTVVFSMHYKIGITIGLQTKGESLWVNGIKQNALSLAELFACSQRGHEVIILNTTTIEPTSELEWDLSSPKTCQLEEFDGDLDVLIALGGALSQHQVDHWRRKGCKVLAYKCGAEYIMSMQSILFNRKLSGPPLFVQNLDAIWSIPQVAETTAAFHATMHRCTVQIVPFVWSSTHLDRVCKTLPNEGFYVPRSAPKRLTVFEPNMDVLKFCLYPILTAELAFREAPQHIESLAVVNAYEIKENAEFRGLMHQLDIVNCGRASFEQRHLTAWFLAHHTDIVISHQWGLPLNYAYLEACWLGYPLIHNAELCSDLGYFYPGFDITAAKNQLIKSIENHDSHAGEYLARQRRNIKPFLSTNTQTISIYDDLLDQLFTK